MRFMTNIQIICKLQPNLLKPLGVMKNYLILVLLIIVTIGCDDEGYQDNNLIPNIVFSKNVNLNLSQYQDLLIPSGFAVLNVTSNNSVIVYNTGNGDQSVDQYLAYDLACPHVEFSSCSQSMDISDFPEMQNSCTSDGIFYRFDIGYSITYMKDSQGNQIALPDGMPVYELQKYNVEVVSRGANGDVNELRISNF